jgi:hypothetical protein
VVFGWALGESANTQQALTAWERCRRTLTGFQIASTNLILHHDQDPVYTSYRWTSQLLLDDGVHISYTLNGARGNTEMEGFISRFKNENRSLFLDAPTLEALQVVVEEAYPKSCTVWTCLYCDSTEPERGLHRFFRDGHDVRLPLTTPYEY